MPDPTSQAAARPPLTWPAISVGGVYADYHFDVDRATLERYAAAVGRAAGTAAPAGAGIRAAHMMLASWTIPRVAFRAWRVPDGVLHAGQSWRFVRAPVAGDRLRLVCRAAEKFVARGRSFVVFAAEATDRDGAPVGSGTMTLVWPG